MRGVLPLIEGRQLGWPVWVWVCLGLSIVVLGAAGMHQRRRTAAGRDPLLDLRLFSERAFDLGLLIVLVYYASTASFFLVLALYLQDGIGMGALGSGLMFATFGAGFPDAFRDSLIYVIALDVAVALLIQLLPSSAPAAAPRPTEKPTENAPKRAEV